MVDPGIQLPMKSGSAGKENDSNGWEIVSPAGMDGRVGSASLSPTPSP